ncbi:hypothetical protein [Acidocella sp.]|uniref:hypothetical protein n=1 Tax=Acidocella sp. TaxID=50710 RepID=UPI0026161F8D|nr:hypothetical protein [Acidocella sp.]
MGLLWGNQGAPLLAGPDARLLFKPLVQNAGGAPFAGPNPAAIAGLTGWWDAGTPAGLCDAGGVALMLPNVAAAVVSDKSGAGSALVAFQASATSPPAMVAAARVNGMLGAVGAPMAGQTLAPALSAEWGLLHLGLEFGAAEAWTRYVVWTRPNWHQGVNNAAAIALLRSMAGQGATVLGADGEGGANLTLFPGTSSQTALSDALTRRHTHAVILRNTPGAGVDVWLDGVQVASAVPNPFPASALGQALFLHDGSPQGSAQCWFHEAATWDHALSAADIETLISAQGRWALGPRKGANVLVMGGSNAALFVGAGGAAALAEGIAWYTGAASWGVVSGVCGAAGGYSIVPGHPLANSGAALFPPGAVGTFLTNPGDGSAPAGWPTGPDFAALSAFLAGIPAADQADIGCLAWPWGEADSTMAYANKAEFEASLLRLLSATRGLLGRTAVSLPLLTWSATPYQTHDGVQMVRETLADLSASPANNIVLFAAQTADSNPLGAAYNALTGSFAAGQTSYRDGADLARYGRLGVHAAGRLALAAGLGDTISLASLPVSGLPEAGGPRLTHAYRASNTELILTIAHDAGDDLLVPLGAARGMGFAVMDGGSVAAPGTIIPAIAAARVDATHLSVTLAAPVTNPSADVRLFYPYGSVQIGRGNAVTDNTATLAPPAGWAIGADLGTCFALNFPLQATAYGLTLSDTPS